MKNIFGFIIILTLAVFVSETSFSQETQPDAVYLKILKEYRLNTDGSVTFHYSHKLKLLSYFAFQRQYGETSVIYDPRYQNVKVNYAYTTMADGKDVPVPLNGYNEVLPDFCVNAPAYNFLRRFVIVHTALEKNAIINVDYEVITQKDYYPCLMGNETIPTYSPVDEEVIIAKVPKNIQLKYKLLNSNIIPVITENGDTVTYRWLFSKVPAVVPENQMLPNSAFLPYLLFSSADDMKPVYRKLINQDAFKNSADKKMIAWVTDLKNKSANEISFLLKLQEEIAVNMKTYNIPLNYCGYRLHDPVKVFYDNGGTPIEKAALMCALLSYGNIKSYPILSAHSSLVDPEIGNLNVFNEVYVRVYTDPVKTIYFPVDKAVKQNSKFSLDDKKLIPLLIELKILDVTTENFQDNFLSLNGTLKMNDKGEISGKSLIFTRGCLNPAFSFISDSTKAVSDLFTGISPVKDKPPRFFERTAMQTNFEQEYNNDPSSVTFQNEYMFFELPYFNDGFESWHIQALNTVRNNPFYLPFPLREHYSISVKLPKNITVVTKDFNINIENDLGKVTMSVKKTKRDLIIYREILLKKQIIDKQDYEKLKALLIPWLNKNERILTFKLQK